MQVAMRFLRRMCLIVRSLLRVEELGTKGYRFDATSGSDPVESLYRGDGQFDAILDPLLLRAAFGFAGNDRCDVATGPNTTDCVGGRADKLAVALLAAVRPAPLRPAPLRPA